MKKAFFLLWSWLLALSICLSPALAAEKELAKAPKWVSDGTWLNGKPPLKKLYAHQLTLVYFWDYTSINCLREMTVLKKWYKEYHRYGFEMVWIHTPEFEFAKNPENVKKAVKSLQIPFPVFLDNVGAVWDQYKIKSWPTKVLIDDHRRIAYTQIGEDKFSLTEREIRRMLKDLNPGAVLPEPVNEFDKPACSLDRCGLMSNETYTGYERATWWGAKIANRQWVEQDKVITFRDYGERPEKGFFVEGVWANREDSMDHARETKGMDDYLGLIYQGHEVYSVISRLKDVPIGRIYVMRDLEPVPAEFRGKDLREDEEGRTYFLAGDSKLYYVISKEDDEPHELRLYPQSSGLSINSFSFSNHCLADFEHL